MGRKWLRLKGQSRQTLQKIWKESSSSEIQGQGNQPWLRLWPNFTEPNTLIWIQSRGKWTDQPSGPTLRRAEIHSCGSSNIQKTGSLKVAIPNCSRQRQLTARR